MPQMQNTTTGRTGERRLMAAVLDDAVRVYGEGSSPRLTPGQYQGVREAKHWFANDDPEWLFSFENVCAVLHLDPAAIRRRLR